MFSTGMRMEEKVLLDRLTKGIYSMPTPLKVNVNCTVVIIILLYGCEMRTNYSCHIVHFRVQFCISLSTPALSPATSLLHTDLGLRLI